MSNSQQKHKVIIDTDPGIDDAMAILLALNHPQIELLGLTTVFGNLHVDGATTNAIDLLEHFGSPEIPVAKGADKPLEKTLGTFPDFVHGKNGFGEITIPKSELNTHDLSAAEFIIEQALKHPQQVTICAIAPLTNLALALKLEPKIASLIKEVVIMGGAIRVNGNVSPVAEANIHNDPHAADIVLNAGWPVTLVGLDVTLKVILDEPFMNKVKNTGVRGKVLYDMSRFYDNFYRSASGYDGFACHDATALAYITNPEYFTCERGPVRVGTDPESMFAGMTIFDGRKNGPSTHHWTDKPKINVCLDIDSDSIKKLLHAYWY